MSEAVAHGARRRQRGVPLVVAYEAIRYRADRLRVRHPEAA